MNFKLINKLMKLHELYSILFSSFVVKYEYNELDKFIALNHSTRKVDNFLYRV
ncbi:hypothetical protein [Tissierella sp.]|uniref:hypothetical protein n=1 Tax=Tissierella sp. TaxID=41274 RepID=UPI00285BCDF0|nr:hypothetical protein [Tissierella sp.]MDR7857909.1 hypothetical protein [Tissierella sp.]